MTKDGKLLTTERSRNKTYPLKWEVTGGSILKGETAAEGAVRELYEETGIKISTETSLYSTAMWISLNMPYITVTLI